MNPSFVNVARRLRTWMTRDALPLWQRVGFDTASGGHYEHLLGDGNPDRESEVRVRVLGRQAFVYALASHRGWCDGEKHARQLLEFAETHASHPDGGFTHRLDAGGQVIDRRRDLYDHAFFVLAYAWCYRAFGDRSFLIKVEKLVALLDREFGSFYGGWCEGDYPHAQRRQNPHMHFFEAFLALYEATGDARWLARTGEIFGLFESRFYEPSVGVLLEFFDDAWNPVSDHIEPGHMVEWVWLLDWYRRHTGRRVERYTAPLFRNALALGQNPAGLLYDVVDARGKPVSSTKRSWGLIELVKASLVLARDGDPDAEAEAARALENLFGFYLCAGTPGAYIDQRDAADQIAVDVAPASTLYHYAALLAEVEDYLAANG